MPDQLVECMLSKSKINYPEIAKRAGIEGKVIIQAFIDENGNVAHAKILKVLVAVVMKWQ